MKIFLNSQFKEKFVKHYYVHFIPPFIFFIFLFSEFFSVSYQWDIDWKLSDVLLILYLTYLVKFCLNHVFQLTTKLKIPTEGK